MQCQSFQRAFTSDYEFNGSDINEDDKIAKAKILYQGSSKDNKPFTMMECW
jgi:hypothetical protein